MYLFNINILVTNFKSGAKNIQLKSDDQSSPVLSPLARANVY